MKFALLVLALSLVLTCLEVVETRYLYPPNNFAPPLVLGLQPIFSAKPANLGDLQVLPQASELGALDARLGTHEASASKSRGLAVGNEDIVSQLKKQREVVTLESNMLDAAATETVAKDATIEGLRLVNLKGGQMLDTAAEETNLAHEMLDAAAAETIKQKQMLQEAVSQNIIGAKWNELQNKMLNVAADEAMVMGSVLQETEQRELAQLQQEAQLKEHNEHLTGQILKANEVLLAKDDEILRLRDMVSPPPPPFPNAPLSPPPPFRRLYPSTPGSFRPTGSVTKVGQMLRGLDPFAGSVMKMKGLSSKAESALQDRGGLALVIGGEHEVLTAQNLTVNSPSVESSDRHMTHYIILSVLLLLTSLSGLVGGMHWAHQKQRKAEQWEDTRPSARELAAAASRSPAVGGFARGPRGGEASQAGHAYASSPAAPTGTPPTYLQHASPPMPPSERGGSTMATSAAPWFQQPKAFRSKVASVTMERRMQSSEQGDPYAPHAQAAGKRADSQYLDAVGSNNPAALSGSQSHRGMGDTNARMSQRVVMRAQEL
ncbi:hypothetical protein CYMTET_44699 [Cymbomonas tetramitiformis]|uniref:Uncharacterized protein n=1 Tax=Cymbomonas tetramitiformis TaxID=36881 RepID=A0AAE0EZC6_9CHLO|nr:hypothetical protein CYMTET_44699 [Cymbomonas tetramitiformis]